MLDGCFIFLHKIVVYRHFSYFQFGFQNGHQRSRDFLLLVVQMKVLYISTFGESFTAICCLVLEILCVEPIYPQYSRVLETCLALRYWVFEVLGSESVKIRNAKLIALEYSSKRKKICRLDSICLL